MTVSLRNEETGERRTRAETGMTAVQALRSIVAEVDTWPGTWKVVAVSTPETIFTDLQGARFSADTERCTIAPYTAERFFLNRVGRGDLAADIGTVPTIDPRTR